MHPRLQKSQQNPYFWPSRTSGARYSEVPHKVLAPSVALTFSLASPKSASLMNPL